MHVNKKLMLLVAVFALALPLMFTGIASATYLSDGATQDTSGTGGWALPNDMGACVTGISSTGAITVDSTITNRRDCLAKIWPAYTTQAACASTSNTEGAAHLWTSTCLATNGTTTVGVSLKGLDLNKTMCTQKVAAMVAGGQLASGYTGTYISGCTGNWQYPGPDATFSNGAYVSGGFDKGFCYTAVDVTGTYGTKAACNGANSAYTPMLNSWNAQSKCSYSYGVKGGITTATSTIKKMDGTTSIAVGGTIPDLTAMNMGTCLLNGLTFNNYATAGGTDSTTFTASTGAPTVGVNVVAGNQNCLRCHSSAAQYNSVAERWKESYLQQGHKNMLRAVTPGYAWGGPDVNGNMALYTGSAVGAINWGTVGVPGSALATTGTGTWPLLYVFGDWMAPAPGGLDVVVNTSSGMKYNGANQYSCTPCHSTGFYDPAGTMGVCSKSSLTTSSSCASGGATWYPSVGFQGAFSKGQEPQATFPTVTYNYGKWDLNGIVCARCHMVTFPEVYDSTFTGAGGNGHDFGPATGTGAAISSMCFGCHQSTVKTSVSGGTGNGPDVDLNNPTAPGVSVTATTADFSGHPIGEEFLNSPHSRYTGTMVPNAVGKYDIGVFTGGAFVPYGTFNTAFNDGSCSQSTYVDGSGNAAEVKTQADCTTAGGTWGYRTDGGSCTSCHDVHNSLFVATQSEKSMKKECTTCHADGSGLQGVGPNKTAVPQVVIANINHPTGNGTPFDTSKFDSPCEVCHMPKASASGFPLHLWRINTSASYTTFPSYADFTAAPPKKLANTQTDDKGYTNAIWVDLDISCGQCHGGSKGSTATANGAPYLTKAQLSTVANGIHGGNPTALFSWTTSTTVDYLVNLDASNSKCPSGSCSYSWAASSGSPTFGPMAVKTTAQFTSSATTTVTLTVTDSATGGQSQKSLAVTPKYVAANPSTIGITSAPVVGFGVTVNYTLGGGVAPYRVKVTWGDGYTTMQSGVASGPSSTTHTYAKTGTFKVTLTATDSGVNGLVTTATTSTTVTITPGTGTVSGLVTRVNGTTPVVSAAVQLKQSGVTKKLVYTNSLGVFNATAVNAGTYDIYVSKSGVTFVNPVATVTSDGLSTLNTGTLSSTN